MTRYIPPHNTELSLDQIRARLQDKLKHLNSRLANLPERMVPYTENEIASTERRLKLLDDKSSQQKGE